MATALLLRRLKLIVHIQPLTNTGAGRFFPFTLYVPTKIAIVLYAAVNCSSFVLICFRIQSSLMYAVISFVFLELFLFRAPFASALSNERGRGMCSNILSAWHKSCEDVSFPFREHRRCHLYPVGMPCSPGPARYEGALATSGLAVVVQSRCVHVSDHTYLLVILYCE